MKRDRIEREGGVEKGVYLRCGNVWLDEDDRVVPVRCD